jgi:hypothetical protein
VFIRCEDVLYESECAPCPSWRGDNAALAKYPDKNDNIFLAILF